MKEYTFNELIDKNIDELESIKLEVLDEYAKLDSVRRGLVADILYIQKMNKDIITKWQLES